MHLLVTSHPRGKTSLRHSKHSFPPKRFHLPFTQQQDNGKKGYIFPELQALFTFVAHFLAVFCVSDQHLSGR